MYSVVLMTVMQDRRRPALTVTDSAAAAVTVAATVAGRLLWRAVTAAVTAATVVVTARIVLLRVLRWWLLGVLLSCSGCWGSCSGCRLLGLHRVPRLLWRR